MSETINGLHSCKPGHEPTIGQVKTFAVIHNPPKGDKKAWIKIKSAGPDFGGQPYRIVSAEPTGYTDSYGNISFNLEIESAEHDSEPPLKKDVTGAYPDQPFRTAPPTVAQHAQQARDTFQIAWKEAGTVMLTAIPEKDAQDMSVDAWYDLQMRIAQGICIEVNRRLH